MEATLQNQILADQNQDTDPMRLHITFLTAMATNWEEYIQDLHMQLLGLVSPMLFVRVTKMCSEHL